MAKQGEFLQEQLDDLVLLSQHADQRAKQLNKMMSEHKAAEQHQLKKLSDSSLSMQAALNGIVSTSNSLKQYVASCQRQSNWSTVLFIGAVLVSVSMIGGSSWWLYRTRARLNAEKAILSSLYPEFLKKPMLVNLHGQDYVRIVPHSERNFTASHSKKVLGRYAKVWSI